MKIYQKDNILLYLLNKVQYFGYNNVNNNFMYLYADCTTFLNNHIHVILKRNTPQQLEVQVQKTLKCYWAACKLEHFLKLQQQHRVYQHCSGQSSDSF